MSLFQQYTNGVQPVTGVSEAGANIGKMYQQGLTNFGLGIAGGVKDYSNDMVEATKEYVKNKRMSDSADAENQGLLTTAQSYANLAKNNPDLAPWADSLQQHMLNHQDFNKKGLGAKLTSNAELKDFLGRFDDFNKQQQVVNADRNFSQSAPLMAQSVKSQLNANLNSLQGIQGTEQQQDVIKKHLGMLDGIENLPTSQQRIILGLTSNVANNFNANLTTSQATNGLLQNQQNTDELLSQHKKNLQQIQDSNPKNESWKYINDAASDLINKIDKAKTPSEKTSVLQGVGAFMTTYPALNQLAGQTEQRRTYSDIISGLNDKNLTSTISQKPAMTEFNSFNSSQTPQEYFNATEKQAESISNLLQKSHGQPVNKDELVRNIINSNINSLEKSGMPAEQVSRFISAANAYDRTKQHYANGEEQDPTDESILNNPLNEKLAEYGGKLPAGTTNQPLSNIMLPPHKYNVGTMEGRANLDENEIKNNVINAIKAKNNGELPPSFASNWAALFPESQFHTVTAPNGATLVYEPKDQSWKEINPPNAEIQNKIKNSQFYEKDDQGNVQRDKNGNAIGERLRGQNSPYVAYGTYTGKDSEKTRADLNGMADAIKTINRLKEITNMQGKSLSPEIRAEAQNLAVHLQSVARNAYFPSGRVAEWEQSRIEQVARNPAVIFSLDSASKKSLDTLKDDLESRLMNYNKGNGIRIEKQEIPKNNPESSISELRKQNRLNQQQFNNHLLKGYTSQPLTQ